MPGVGSGLLFPECCLGSRGVEISEGKSTVSTGHVTSHCPQLVGWDPLCQYFLCPRRTVRNLKLFTPAAPFQVRALRRGALAESERPSRTERTRITRERPSCPSRRNSAAARGTGNTTEQKQSPHQEPGQCQGQSAGRGTNPSPDSPQHFTIDPASLRRAHRAGSPGSQTQDPCTLCCHVQRGSDWQCFALPLH